jgi:hypothetical protein
MRYRIEREDVVMAYFIAKSNVTEKKQEPSTIELNAGAGIELAISGVRSKSANK